MNAITYESSPQTKNFLCFLKPFVDKSAFRGIIGELCSVLITKFVDVALSCSSFLVKKIQQKQKNFALKLGHVENRAGEI